MDIEKIGIKRLKKIHQDYITQYDNLDSVSFVSRFLDNFSTYISRSMPDIDLHTYIERQTALGLHRIILYRGYVPLDRLEELSHPLIKFIKEEFNLKKFTGFNIIIKNKAEIGSFSTIYLTWILEETAPILPDDSARVEESIIEEHIENHKKDKKDKKKDKDKNKDKKRHRSYGLSSIALQKLAKINHLINMSDYAKLHDDRARDVNEQLDERENELENVLSIRKSDIIRSMS